MASNRATSSRWIIHQVFELGEAAPHVITPVDIHLGPRIMLLLANVVAAPAPGSYSDAQPSAGSSVPENSYDYFIPSVAIIIAVLVVGVLFMGLFSVCVCWYARIAAESRNLHRRRLSNGGLDPRAIESFPIFHYSEVKDHRIGRGALECAVCISEFQDDETMRLLPKCDHVFHPECIDAWLAFHTTCPICRANLKSTTSDENPCHTARVTESDDSATEEQNIGPEIDGVQNENDNQNQIAIDVDEDQNRDLQPQVGDAPNRNERRVAKFPRWHSTGHSLVLPGESCERYTLRLSEAARQQIISQRLKRTSSLWGISFPTIEESSRRGYRSGGEGSSRGRQVGRWVRAMTPPFLSRSGSIMSAKWGVNGDVTNVLTPFSWLAGKSDGVENSSNHPL